MSRFMPFLKSDTRSRLVPVPGVGAVRMLVPFVLVMPNQVVVIRNLLSWSSVIAIQSSLVLTDCPM
jgi:hypothetical protein